MWTVYHVSASGKTGNGVMDKVMNGIDVWVGAYKWWFLLKACTNVVGSYIIGNGSFSPSLNPHVLISMIIELVAEYFVTVSGCYIDIFIWWAEIAGGIHDITIGESNGLAFFEISESDTCPSYHTLAHVNNPRAVMGFWLTPYFRWFNCLLNLVGLTGHWCDFTFGYRGFPGFLPF